MLHKMLIFKHGIDFSSVWRATLFPTLFPEEEGIPSSKRNQFQLELIPKLGIKSWNQVQNSYSGLQYPCTGAALCPYRPYQLSSIGASLPPPCHPLPYSILDTAPQYTVQRSNCKIAKGRIICDLVYINLVLLLGNGLRISRKVSKKVPTETFLNTFKKGNFCMTEKE